MRPLRTVAAIATCSLVVAIAGCGSGSDDAPAAAVPATTAAAAAAPQGGFTVVTPGPETPVPTKVPPGSPQQTQSEVRTMALELEACFTDRQDYRSCMKDSQIGVVFAAHGFTRAKGTPAPGELAIKATAQDSFRVTGTATDGTHYILSRAHGSGKIKRVCKATAPMVCDSPTW